MFIFLRWCIDWFTVVDWLVSITTVLSIGCTAVLSIGCSQSIFITPLLRLFRSLASSPLASGSASPRSPISTSIGAAELTQRLAAKGLLPQQLPQFQHLQQPQQVVISPAETLVISTSAIDGENYIVSSANRWAGLRLINIIGLHSFSNTCS